MSESLRTKGQNSILVNKTEAQLQDWIDEYTLSVGGDTSRAGMWVTSEGEVTAGTPTTHKNVDLAVAYSAENNQALKPAGVILRPKILPDGYDIDDTIVDGTVVLVLRTGAPAIIRTFYADASDNVLPGQLLSLSATAGMLGKTTFSFTATPTVGELEAALGAYVEAVGWATAVAEDVAGTNLVVHMQMI